MQELLDLFGEIIANTVAGCSDDKSLDKVMRKKLQIVHAKASNDLVKLVKGADKYSNLKSLFNNPPQNWTKEEIKGYFYWSFSVFLAISGVNLELDNKLWDLFYKFGIVESNLDKELETYYTLIDKSE